VDLLEEMASEGFSPNLLNDDDGRWALVFDGFQTVVVDGPQDVETGFVVGKEQWHDSVSAAIVYALKNITNEEDSEQKTSGSADDVQSGEAPI
jgi:hypothetical protein